MIGGYHPAAPALDGRAVSGLAQQSASPSDEAYPEGSGLDAALRVGAISDADQDVLDEWGVTIGADDATGHLLFTVPPGVWQLTFSVLASIPSGVDDERLIVTPGVLSSALQPWVLNEFTVEPLDTGTLTVRSDRGGVNTLGPLRIGSDGWFRAVLASVALAAGQNPADSSVSSLDLTQWVLTKVSD